MIKETKIYCEYDNNTESYNVYSYGIDLKNDSELSNNIVKAISDMSVYYTDLEYTGFLDEHKYIIFGIKNNINNIYLTDKEIVEMYYEAFSPECIMI